MTLVYGGAAVRLLSPSVYNFMSGMDTSDIVVSLHEVTDEHIRDMLDKV